MRERASGLLVPEVEPILVPLHPGRPGRDPIRETLRELQRVSDGESDGLPPIGGGASASDYLENKLLDHALGKTSFTMPATVALALCTVVPTDASTGSTITEASYTGYARKVVAGADLNAASGGSSSNANALAFAACTAGSSTIIAWALCDNSGTGAGNILFWGTAASTVISTTQTPATIGVGVLVVTAD